MTTFGLGIACQHPGKIQADPGLKGLECASLSRTKLCLLRPSADDTNQALSWKNLGPESKSGIVRTIIDSVGIVITALSRRSVSDCDKLKLLTTCDSML